MKSLKTSAFDVPTIPDAQNAAELIDRYQQRIFTRMKEMLFPIAFTGKNKRGGVR